METGEGPVSLGTLRDSSSSPAEVGISQELPQPLPRGSYGN